MQSIDASSYFDNVSRTLLDASTPAKVAAGFFFCCVVTHAFVPLLIHIAQCIYSSTGCIDDSCCARLLARSAKCDRRRRRRKQGQEEACNWSCPFDNSFAQLRLPPPLPFHRRRRRPANTTQTCTLENRSCNHDKTLVNGSDHKKSSPDYHAAASQVPSNHKTVKVGHNFMPTPAFNTTLLDLARMQQWQVLVAQVNKKEAKRCDADGLYPLHWACSGGPPAGVVEALLKAYPRAVRKVDQQGSTVLHFACHYGASAAVVQLLLKAYPKATKKQDKFGRTPLFHAVRKSAGMETLKKLVEADPSSITTVCKLPQRTSTGPTSGHSALFFSWAAVLRDREARRPGKKWEKASFLLKEAYFHHLRENKKFESAQELYLIPAMITLFSYLPTQVLELAIQAYPDQLHLVDPVTEKLPLALAASLIHPGRADDVFRAILHSCPTAASAVDSHNRSALACAVESGKRWNQGVERLFRAAPETVGLVDRCSKLPPVALAAAAFSKPVQSTEPNPAANEEEEKHTDMVGLNKELDLRKSLLSKHLPTKKKDAMINSDPETQHLSTVYDLLLKDPTIISCATK